MTRYRFELAVPSDDAALRRVMSQTPMPGYVALSFEREPSYLESSAVHGRQRQTVVCRDTKFDEIVGVATRCVREMFVAGEKQPVGYLGGLRFVKHARKLGLLARGYRFVRELHDSDPNAPPFYLTTIADGNTDAINSLTSERAGLPTYHLLSRLHTLVLPIQNRVDYSRLTALTKCQMSDLADAEQLIEFLNVQGSCKTFLPAYETDDFGRSDSTFRELDTSSIVLARRDGKIVGAAGVWDQRPFRQTIVRGYSRTIGILRPLINQWSRLTGGIQLPRVGEPLNACYVCFPVVAGDDAAVFHLIMRRLVQLAPADASCLLLGLCEDDPLHRIAASLCRWQYTTRLYAVSWDRISDSVIHQTARPHYLELGCL